MGTMSLMTVNSAEPAVKQGVSQAAADSNRPDAGNGAVDAVFAILMDQLFGALLQTVQPTASKTDKPAPVDEASTSMNSAPLPVVQIQAQVPSALQPASVDTPSIQVPQNQKEAAGKEKAEQLPEPRKADSNKKVNQKLSTLETEGFFPDQDVKATKPGHNEEIALYHSTKKEDSAVLLTQDSAAQTGRGKRNEGDEKEGQPAIAQAKADFTVPMRPEQPAAQLQATYAAAARRMDNPQGHALVGLHGTDPSELFDHTVSIVKDGNRLAVQLEPDGLGKLDINLSLDKGVVNAQIHVADDAARNLIANNMQQIVNTLLGEGLSVGGFSVSLKQHGAGDGTTERRHDDTQQKNGLPPGAIGLPGPSAAQGLVNIFI